jgi:hypothetical protein
MGKPSKDNPWLEIFRRYDIFSHDFDKSPFFIDAQQIKIACSHFKTTAEKEVRILCYQAQRNDMPDIFVKNNLFLLPIRNGKYAIIRGEGYIDIPLIESKPIRFTPFLSFSLESSDVGDSEMQHLDFAFACGMIEHFVDVGKLYLTVRGRKYTPEFDFKVGNVSIHQESVQTEVDAGYEGANHIVLIEGKNIKMSDIIIRQLYYPYRKWTEETSKTVLPLFFEKRGEEYMFWMYEFTDLNHYNSIKLVKSRRYVLDWK